MSLLAPGGRAEPVVFAAASMRAVLQEVIGTPATLSYGASGIMARQVAQGAPVDLFISANPAWMRYLVDHGLVDPAQVQVLTSNALVLIAAGDPDPLPLERPAVATRLSGGYLAMGDPGFAPVGQYGKDALETLGLWSVVEPALLPTRNTIATVATVAREEAALGLVYRSDAVLAEKVRIVAELPAKTHAPILYYMAPVAQGDDPEGALALVAQLRDDDTQARFEAFGFAAPATAQDWRSE